MKIAIIGSGISGLAAAHVLRGHAQVTLFEAGAWFGGHTHTVNVTLPTPQGTVTHGVDTGFLVFNERTYPQLIAFLAELQVEVAKSNMSFSVQVPGGTAANPGPSPLEWSGTSLASVFCQKRNLLRPGFYRMLWDLRRFNQLATALATHGRATALTQSVASFLDDHDFSAEFRQWYLLPMLGCIWSCPLDQMLKFPVATLVRFCHNHSLLQITDRPQWWTVTGGARHYVDKIVARIPDARLSTPVRRIERNGSGVRVFTSTGSEYFDKLICATHSDQALALLAAPTAQEASVLGAIRYQPNRAVLHTDASVLPRHESAWAAWNFEGHGAAANNDSTASGGAHDNTPRVCLHYLLNQLQPLPFKQPVLVSLNPLREIAPALVIDQFHYDHPIFDRAAIAAQQKAHSLQGRLHTYFCGAWLGYGFHEDGLKAGLAAARQLLADCQLQPAAGTRDNASQPSHSEAGAFA